MVRLKVVGVISPLENERYFNSTMVRLKEKQLTIGERLQILFQFHNGTIKST
jgi:hypothetical protein